MVSNCSGRSLSGVIMAGALPESNWEGTMVILLQVARS